MRDKVTFVVVQAVVPVMKILRKVHLLCRPKRGFSLLVRLPDLMILDREQNEAAFGLHEERLLTLGEIDIANETFTIQLLVFNIFCLGQW